MTATAKKIEPPASPVHDAAQRALKKAKGDVQKAAAILEDMVRSDANLREALLDPLIARACYDACRELTHQERRAIWAPPPVKRVPGKVTGAKRVIQLAGGNLLAFPLPGGKKLGEATHDEIASAARFYESQAGDMAAKARWLQLVAQSVPDGKTVGDVLSDKRLRELQREASRESE